MPYKASKTLTALLEDEALTQEYGVLSWYFAEPKTHDGDFSPTINRASLWKHVSHFQDILYGSI